MDKLINIREANHNDCYQLLVSDLFLSDLPDRIFVQGNSRKPLFSVVRTIFWPVDDKSGTQPNHQYKVKVFIRNLTPYPIPIDFNEGPKEEFGWAIQRMFG